MAAVDAPLLTTVGAEGYGARATTSAAQRHQHPLTTSGWSNARAKVLLLAVVAVCGAAFASTRGTMMTNPFAAGGFLSSSSTMPFSFWTTRADDHAFSAKLYPGMKPPQDRDEDAGVLGQDGGAGCPAVPPLTWEEHTVEGSAHLLVLGDSTDKLWHSEMCSLLLPEAQRCEYLGTTPDADGLPKNMQPWVCADDDARCSGNQSCYDPPGTSCWQGEEHRTAAACKPLDPSGSILAFTHMAETAQDFDLCSQPFAAPYCSGELAAASKVGDRVNAAVSAFAKLTETRPMVVVIDVLFWWVAMRFSGFGNPTIQDPAYVEEHFDEVVQQYHDGIVGLVELVRGGCAALGRPCAIVGKANHNPGHAEGSIELKLHLALREVLRGVFAGKDADGLYFYDWYQVAVDAIKDGQWDMLDDMHQGPLASRVETAAFEAFTKTAMPAGYGVNLGGT